MKNSVSLLSALLLSASVFAANPVMNQDPSKGMDGELFLKPFIESALKDVSGEVIFDAGSALALQSVKDCEKLPYAANTFDKAFSVNMSASMPSTMYVMSENECHEVGLGVYFSEIGRVMKEGAQLIVAAPASYDVVFTDGTIGEEMVREHIAQVLAAIGDSNDSELITNQLMELNEVMRATFVHSNGALKLVTSEKELVVGQPIWCKIPDGVVASVYHSEAEHLMAIKQAGLICDEIKRPCFFGPVKYKMWQKAHSGEKSLGASYMNNHPFTLYYVSK